MAKGVNCYPVNRDARRAWMEGQSPTYIPHPQPEVMARPAQPHEIPLGARRMAKVAEANDWNVLITYARGTTLTARGLAGKVVDDLLLRMARPAPGGYATAVASWIDGGFDLAYISLPGEVGHKVSAKDLKAFLSTVAYAVAVAA